MITVNNISKSFDNIKIINDVSTVFDKGKTNLIIGQSGSCLLYTSDAADE